MQYKKSLIGLFNYLRGNYIFLATVIGIFTGLIGSAFKFCVVFVFTNVTYVTSNPQHWIEYLYLPLIIGAGGAIAGLIIKYVPESSGSGIPEIRLQINNIGKAFRHRNIIAKFVASVATIGSGFSLGKEGPTVTIGAGIGQLTSSIFRLTGKKERVLMSAGAGAGLATAFNTPVTGVVFVIEEFLHTISPQYLVPCMLAAIIASSISKHLDQGKTYFTAIVKPEILGFEQIGCYIILGILAGIIGTCFIQITLNSLDMFDKEKNFPTWVKIAMLGVITGIVGIFLPDVLSGGQIGTQKILDGENTIFILLALLILKLILTAMSNGSKAPGGIFAPILFCGAALGLLFGKIILFYAPSSELIPTNIAIVGMGAIFGAVFRIPITATIMVSEVTGDFTLIVPLMISCLLANIVSSKLLPRAIYPALIFRSKGIDIEEDEYTIGSLEKIKVSEVMSTQILTLQETQSIDHAFDKMKKSHHNTFPILNEANDLIGIITLSDIEKAFLRNVDGNLKINEIMSTNLITISPDEGISNALELMHTNNIGRLLVVNKDNPNKLAGLLTKSDVIKADLKII